MPEVTVKSKFYTFNQNNSGGSFVFDEEAGITHFVVIEALDEKHAISRAEDIGIYFNGVNSGSDCECCGDRWYEPYDGHEYPEVYGENVRGLGVVKAFSVWMPEGKEVCVHTLDGNKEWYGVEK